MPLGISLEPENLNFLSIARKYGVEHIELKGFNFDQEEHVKIAENLSEEFSISIHPWAWLPLASRVERMRRAAIEEVLSNLSLLEQLNGEFLTLHLGIHDGRTKEKEEGFQRLIPSLLEIVSKCNSVIALENSIPRPKLFGTSFLEFSHIFQCIKDDRLKLCLDVGHAILSGDLRKYLESFSKKIVALHLHENSGRKDEHLPPGSGYLDWSFLESFKERFLILEVESAEGLESGLKFLREII